MAQDYHHGVRVVEVNEGTRSITTVAHHWHCCDAGLLHRATPQIYLLRRCRLCAARHY